MRYILSALALCVASVAAAPNASADEDDGYGKSDWPLSVVERPLVLAQGMLELRGDTLRVNLSKDAALEPISLAPHVFYGVAKGLTVGITHDTGICLTGTDGGCAKTYNDVGLEAQYALMGKGSFQLAAAGGVSMASLSDPFIAGLDIGLLAKLRAGKIAIVVRPGVRIGVTERDLVGDIVDVPVDLQYQVQPQTALAIETGFSGALDDLGGANQVPVGLAAIFAVNEKIDFGAAFRLTNLAGTDGGVDGRELIARFALRL